jgi:hypothetical protein
MKSKFAVSLVVATLWLPCVMLADTNPTGNPETPATPHHTHKVKKTLPPPLPSGPRGPVPQVPLDALPAVAPQVTFENGLLTIVAPNSTLGDVLREVRSRTSADIDVPANANERIALRLGPAPARDVMSELLNGSRFNYVLLGSADNANALVRVVLVAKTGPDTPDAPAAQANAAPGPNAARADEAADSEPVDTVDPVADQAATEAEETPSTDEPGVKTPQQMLQEMQQRQLQLQQQQQNGGQTTPVYPPPGGTPMPQRGPGSQPQQQDQ